MQRKMFKMEKNYKMVLAFTKKNHAAVRSILIKRGKFGYNPKSSGQESTGMRGG